MEAVREHEVSLTGYALRTLSERLGDKLTVHGPAEPAMRGGTLSLDLVGVHAHDISQILDEAGVCVRAGHHYAKPLLRRLSLTATARARSEERRVGKECVRTGRSRGSPYH